MQDPQTSLEGEGSSIVLSPPVLEAPAHVCGEGREPPEWESHSSLPSLRLQARLRLLIKKAPERAAYQL